MYVLLQISFIVSGRITTTASYIVQVCVYNVYMCTFVLLDVLKLSLHNSYEPKQKRTNLKHHNYININEPILIKYWHIINYCLNS